MLTIHFPLCITLCCCSHVTFERTLQYPSAFHLTCTLIFCFGSAHSQENFFNVWTFIKNRIYRYYREMVWFHYFLSFVCCLCVFTSVFTSLRCRIESWEKVANYSLKNYEESMKKNKIVEIEASTDLCECFDGCSCHCFLSSLLKSLPILHCKHLISDELWRFNNSYLNEWWVIHPRRYSRTIQRREMWSWRIELFQRESLPPEWPIFDLPATTSAHSSEDQSSTFMLIRGWPIQRAKIPESIVPGESWNACSHLWIHQTWSRNHNIEK